MSVISRINNNNNTLCKVLECRYPGTHTTISHRCGTCQRYGHGQLECFSSSDIRNLEQYYQESMPEELQCTIDGCVHNWSHSSSAHHCSKCNTRANHSISNCRSRNICNNYLERINTINTINNDNQDRDSDEDSDAEFENVQKTCPFCKQVSGTDLKFEIFTDNNCVVCLEKEKKIIFQGCKHAVVCKGCWKQLD